MLRPLVGTLLLAGLVGTAAGVGLGLTQQRPQQRQQQRQQRRQPQQPQPFMVAALSAFGASETIARAELFIDEELPPVTVALTIDHAAVAADLGQPLRATTLTIFATAQANPSNSHPPPHTHTHAHFDFPGCL